MIAHRITSLRKKHGWSQMQLARKLHISASSEGNYEQGRRLPDVETLVLMAEIFDVSLDYLITGKEHTPSGENNMLRTACPCDSCFWKDYSSIR